MNSTCWLVWVVCVNWWIQTNGMCTLCLPFGSATVLNLDSNIFNYNFQTVCTLSVRLAWKKDYYLELKTELETLDWCYFSKFFCLSWWFWYSLFSIEYENRTKVNIQINNKNISILPENDVCNTNLHIAKRVHWGSKKLMQQTGRTEPGI